MVCYGIFWSGQWRQLINFYSFLFIQSILCVNIFGWAAIVLGDFGCVVT